LPLYLLDGSIYDFRAKNKNLLKLPSLQLSAIPQNCVQCHTCTTNCPMSLPVEDMVKTKKMENTECVLCGTCVDGCKSKSIDYEFGVKR